MNKVKILFLAANSADTARLRLDEEHRQITAKIRASEHRDALELISRWAVQPTDVIQAILEHKPHIVHFSGHGSEAEELILLDQAGHQNPVSKGALSEVFRTLKGDIRVVVLNACRTRPQAQAIATTIDCTIGMNRDIGDEAAILFAAHVYLAIGCGRSLRDAFELGKAALLLEGIPEEKNPQLFVRDGVDAARIRLVTPPSNWPEDIIRPTASSRRENEASNFSYALCVYIIVASAVFGGFALKNGQFLYLTVLMIIIVLFVMILVLTERWFRLKDRGARWGGDIPHPESKLHDSIFEILSKGWNSQKLRSAITSNKTTTASLSDRIVQGRYKLYSVAGEDK
jgi:hypothetical protein